MWPRPMWLTLRRSRAPSRKQSLRLSAAPVLCLVPFFMGTPTQGEMPGSASSSPHSLCDVGKFRTKRPAPNQEHIGRLEEPERRKPVARAVELFVEGDSRQLPRLMHHYMSPELFTGCYNARQDDVKGAIA